MKHSLLILTLLWSKCGLAKTPSWTVQPNICIAQKVGETCHIELVITTQNLQSGVYCLFIGSKKVICSQKGGLPRKLALSYSENISLVLKDKTGSQVLSHNLSIKYIEAKKYRRRIRNPWSIF